MQLCGPGIEGSAKKEIPSWKMPGFSFTGIAVGGLLIMERKATRQSHTLRQKGELGSQSSWKHALILQKRKTCKYFCSSDFPI